MSTNTFTFAGFTAARWNLIQKGVKVTSFRWRQRDFEKLFFSSEDIVYCNDADGLFGALGHVHNAALGHVHNGALGNVHNGALDHVHNGALGHVHNGALGHVHNGALGHVHNGSLDHVHNGSLGHVHNGSLDHVHNGSLGHGHNGALGHVHNGALGHVHNPEDLRLFIDSMKVSLKAVLLHSGIIYPSLLLAYSVYMKKSHERTRTSFTCTDYDKYK